MKKETESYCQYCKYDLILLSAADRSSVQSQISDGGPREAKSE